MAIKPELNVAKAYEKIKANKYNENFDILLNYIEEVSEELELRVNTINSQLSSSILSNLQAVYSVGSLYISATDTCPIANLFGTWEKVSEGRVLQGVSGSQEAGSTLEAGLPNIEGTFRAESQGNGAPTGAFTATKRKGGVHSGEGGAQENIYTFNASTSNEIYGKAETVQPPAYLVNIWKRTA